MELSTIRDLEIYVYREKEYKDGHKKVVRTLLTDDLKIGEIGYFSNSERNYIEKLEENKYKYRRFDEIQTHAIPTYCTNSIDDIRNKILKHLDYDIKYADDRVKLVENLLTENTWIYDLVSTNKMIIKEQKKKADFLAEDQAYDKVMDSISSYINHAKFKNKQDEDEHNNLRKQEEKIKKKKRKKDDDYKELNKVIDLIQNYHHKITKKKIDNRPDTELCADLEQREAIGDFIYTEENSHRDKSSKYHYRKNDLPDDYWENMFYKGRKYIPFYDNDEDIRSQDSVEFRPKLLRTLKDEVDRLHKYLGLHLSSSEEKKLHTKNLITMIGDRDYRILRRNYNELKYDYELAKKHLTHEIHLTPSKHSTVYDINSDTWYENKSGDIVEVSKNYLSMGNKDTYRALLLFYKELRDKYKDNQTSDWWALIKDFENVLSKTDLTDEERFVLDVIFDGHSQKEIEKKYKNTKLEGYTQVKLSRLINDQIPSKLESTYLNLVDEWLYTYKLKGTFKRCTKCGKIKLISNERYFGKHPSTLDKYQSNCKRCNNLMKK